MTNAFDRDDRHYDRHDVVGDVDLTAAAADDVGDRFVAAVHPNYCDCLPVLVQCKRPGTSQTYAYEDFHRIASPWLDRQPKRCDHLPGSLIDFRPMTSRRISHAKWCVDPIWVLQTKMGRQ